MLLALVLRSVVAGAYLTALAVHNVFDGVAVLVAAAIVLIWAAPLVRDVARRRHESLVTPGRVALDDRDGHGLRSIGR